MTINRIRCISCGNDIFDELDRNDTCCMWCGAPIPYTTDLSKDQLKKINELEKRNKNQREQERKDYERKVRRDDSLIYGFFIVSIIIGFGIYGLGTSSNNSPSNVDYLEPYRPNNPKIELKIERIGPRGID